jgi:hypothetical protein
MLGLGGMVSWSLGEDAQEGGVVWCHGGIIGMINGVYADLNLEDGSVVRWR